MSTGDGLFLGWILGSIATGVTLIVRDHARARRLAREVRATMVRVDRPPGLRVTAKQIEDAVGKLQPAFWLQFYGPRETGHTERTGWLIFDTVPDVEMLRETLAVVGRTITHCRAEVGGLS